MKLWHSSRLIVICCALIVVVTTCMYCASSVQAGCSSGYAGISATDVELVGTESCSLDKWNIYYKVAGASTYTYLTYYTNTGVCDTDYVNCQGEDDNTGDEYPPKPTVATTQLNSTTAQIDVTVTRYDPTFTSCDCADEESFTDPTISQVYISDVNDCAP